MYVIIANEAREMLSHLDIDVMKSVEEFIRQMKLFQCLRTSFMLE